VTAALITALTWAAFLAFFFYRGTRDRHLNYLAGQPFRRWITGRMGSVLADSEATPAALQFAGLLLSLVYDRSRLRAVAVHAAPQANPVVFPARELGKHAGLIKRAVQYATVLALLETKGFGAGMRKFLGGYDMDALDAGAHMPISAGDSTVLPADPAWAAEAVCGFVQSPRGRAYEYAIEGEALACAA